ncbi:TonB-dependent receptor plug domain-containing protein [Campylobacter sp.]|uniref:TonB-dependent receptor plug domain-containing protein n=1 Tax=Campylobacter sp. TaxID=205 RepID=UPI0026F82027|nr:TonB-dependent receptor plug domain-containing protein [Campylobacter sp.]
MKKAFQISFIATALIANEITLQKIEVVTKYDANESTSYASSSKLTRDKLDKTASKNHTIADSLKSNPSVAFGRISDLGIDAGEIKPQDFSINGAKFYQNNFLIDGANFNHDINPANRNSNGHETPHYHVERAASLSGQSLTLDTDLLESIEVIDSSVSARYGNFQGGVVNAKTRDPKRKFSGVLSSQYTTGEWQKTFIHEDNEQIYKSRSGFDKSDFSKRRYRVGLEGYLNENFGLLFDYIRLQSLIKYDIKSELINSEIAEIPDDKRVAENYFLKGIWEANDRVILKPGVLYSMQRNRMFEEDSLDSSMLYKYGGISANLNMDIDLDRVFLEQILSYSKFTTSRYTDNKGAKYDYQKSSVKNWGYEDISSYGSVSDVKQDQTGLEYKLNAKFEEFDTFGIWHAISSGFEISRTSGIYEILKPYEHYGWPKPILDGHICAPDDKTCVNDDSFADVPGATGQFLSQKTYYGNVKNKVNMNKIALYIEDELKFNRLKIRPGIRVQKDNFDNDILIAPRFVTEYEIFDRNFIGFGLNRYYGRNLFAYKIYNDTQKYRLYYERDKAGDPFVNTYIFPETNGESELKTPHDDEKSLFYRGDVGNARINLKYIKRDSKNEVLTLNGELIGREKDKSYFVNKGKSSAEIYTFSVSNIYPIKIFGSKNDFELSFTRTSKKSNFRDYADNNSEKLIIYEGKVVKASELPVIDYNVPFSVKFGHNVNFSSFNISNFINHIGKTPVLTSKYNRKLKLTEYSKIELPSRTIWDMRISYEKNLKDDLRFFTNLDINNVLNKKYPISASKKHFGAGRNFWLEMGVRW